LVRGKAAAFLATGGVVDLRRGSPRSENAAHF